MDEGRPIPLLVAVVALGLIGIGSVLAAPLLMGEATGADGLDDQLGAIGGGILMLAGLVTGALGILGLAAAAGLWVRRAWGWALGILVTVLVSIGTLVAVSSGATESVLMLGFVLGLTGLLATWWPETRRACGI